MTATSPTDRITTTIARLAGGGDAWKIVSPPVVPGKGRIKYGYIVVAAAASKPARKTIDAQNVDVAFPRCAKRRTATSEARATTLATLAAGAPGRTPRS